LLRDTAHCCLGYKVLFNAGNWFLDNVAIEIIFLRTTLEREVKSDQNAPDYYNTNLS
jgi:hypothetical protein